MAARLLFWGILFLLVVYNLATTCPKDSSVYPCMCQSFRDGAYLKCENIANKVTLDNVLHRNDSMTFEQLQIFSSHLEALSGDSLAIKNLKTIVITNTTLDSLFDEVPSSDNTLESLVLENITLSKGLQWEHFHNLIHLKDILMGNVDILTLDDAFSQNIPQTLPVIMFEKTRTCHLSDNVFADINDLKILAIQDGQIKDLKRSMFPRPAKLEIFSFDGQKLEALPDDLFSEMPKLKMIGLSNNKLHALSETVFGDVFKHLRILFFADNPLKCDCNIHWITKVDKTGKILDVVCKFENSEGKYITDLTDKDFLSCFENNSLTRFL